MSDDLTRFRELCFLFVCNKLDASEVAWMESMLLVHPELAAEVEAGREAAAQARIGLAASYHAAHPLLSFDEMIAGFRASEPTRMRRMLTRITQSWHGSLSSPWATGAIALLVISVSVQTYRLEETRSEGLQDRYRGVPQQANAQRPVLKVIFTDQLSMGELRVMLANMKLDIVRGPDEQGVVWLAVNEGTSAQALANLQGNKAVIDVQVVDEGK